MIYTHIGQAAHGIGVSTMTLTRWRKHGHLHWEHGQPLDHGALIALKDQLHQAWKANVISKAKTRRKYFTKDEDATARYQAVKRYRKANKAKVNAEDRQSKALKRHPFFVEMKQEMIEYYGDKCLSCKRRKSNCMDHVIPLAQNGGNYPANLQPLCRRCNTSKQRQSTDFRHDKGKWLAIRWGGWRVNGNKGRLGAGGELGSRWDGWQMGHAESIKQWRLPRAHAGALLSPLEYKSFVIKPPIGNKAMMTDGD